VTAFSTVTRAEGYPTTTILREGDTGYKMREKAFRLIGEEKTVVEVGHHMIFLVFFRRKAPLTLFYV